MHSTRRERISSGATEKLPGSEKRGANATAWSYVMEGLAKNSVERYCELANTSIDQLYKVSHLVLTTISSKKKRAGNGVLACGRAFFRHPIWLARPWRVSARPPATAPWPAALRLPPLIASLLWRFSRHCFACLPFCPLSATALFSLGVAFVSSLCSPQPLFSRVALPSQFLMSALRGNALRELIALFSAIASQAEAVACFQQGHFGRSLQGSIPASGLACILCAHSVRFASAPP